jgi:polyhydroxybutyrate depolymerase
VYNLLDEWKTINGITTPSDTFRNDSRIKGILYPSHDSSANIILYTSETGGHEWEINSRLGTTNRIWEFFSSQINKTEIIYDTIPEGTRKRDFKIHIPSRYYTSIDTSRKYPLIVAAHGWNSDASQMETMTGFSNKANSKDFFVAYLHYVGPPPDYSWNYFMDEEKPDDIGYSKAAIDTLFARYPIDSQKVYAVGFSDGCGLANRLSQETDGLIRATGTVGGMVSFGPDIQDTPVRMIHLHAKNDPAVSYSNVRNTGLAAWLETNACSMVPDTIYNEQGYTGEMWKNSNNDTMVLFYTIPWNQHAWPVNNQNGVNISATDMIWDFFENGIAIPNIPPVTAFNEVSVKKSALSVYPNPAENQLNVSIDLQNEDYLYLQLSQINGQKTERFVLGHAFAGANNYLLNIENLAKGYYMLTLTGYNSTFHRSVIIH